MKSIRKSVAGVVVAGTLATGWFVGGTLFRDAQFARAEQQVNASREQIANVQDMATVFKAVGKAVEPSVVSIDVTKTVRNAHRINPNQLRQFFPDRDGDGQPDLPEGFDFPDTPEDSVQQGTGSGVIVETDGSTGYILTNNHVAGGASEMLVTLSDGREIKNAKLVGADPKSDVAVLKIEADHLIAAKWGNSEELEKGDIILAFGSPFGYVGSMTHGIVSALNRDHVGIISRSSKFAYENFIQVDAQINPGNSGGPLVNLKGEVVGINTAIATDTGSFQGIGFAIPSNQAKPLYEAIRSKGRVVRGWLGVEIKDVAQFPDEAASVGYSGKAGVLVGGLMLKTPSYGKLEAGDVITALNGKQINTMSQLRNQIATIAPGTDVKLSVVRAGKPRDVTITLGEQPDDLTQVASAGDNGKAGDAANGKNTAQSLGIRVASATPTLLKRYSLDEGVEGAIVTGVSPTSLAVRAGLRPGDVITKIDDTPVSNADDLESALADKDLSKGVKVYWTNRESNRFAFIKSEK